MPSPRIHTLSLMKARTHTQVDQLSGHPRSDKRWCYLGISLFRLPPRLQLSTDNGQRPSNPIALQGPGFWFRARTGEWLRCHGPCGFLIAQGAQVCLTGPSLVSLTPYPKPSFLEVPWVTKEVSSFLMSPQAFSSPGSRLQGPLSSPHQKLDLLAESPLPAASPLLAVQDTGVALCPLGLTACLRNRTRTGGLSPTWGPRMARVPSSLVFCRCGGPQLGNS